MAVSHLLGVLVEHLERGGGGDRLATHKDGERSSNCGLSLQHVFAAEVFACAEIFNLYRRAPKFVR